MGAMRVALVALVALASAAGVAALVWRAAWPSEMRARTDAEVLVLAKHVAEHVVPAQAQPDPAQQTAALAELAASLQLDLALHDTSGRVTAVAGGAILPLGQDEQAAVLSGLVRRVGAPWPPRVAAPVEWNGRRVGYVLIGLAGAPPASPALPLALALALAVVSSALCAGLARGSGSAVKRLEAALDVLETLPRGEALDVEGQRELAGAADRINRLLDRAAAAAERDEELLAIVARELKRPVHDARDTLRRMASGQPFPHGPGELDEELDILETILEDVLTTARLKLDRMILRKRRTRLGVLVQDAAAKVASTNPVTFDVDPDLPEVDVDGRLMARALAEIVVNAAQHSDAGASISVQAHARGTRVAVQVTDGGGGISPEDRERLFEPFFRSRGAKRHLAGQTGLGLTLAKRVIEAHGGTLGVESEPGVGTTVALTLPIATGEPPEERYSMEGSVPRQR